MATVTTAEHLFTDRVLPAVLHRMRKIPLKIGIRIEPPSIIYIYKEAGVLRMRSMPLRNLWTNSDVNFVIEELRNRHGEHIEDVPDFALRKMINIIKIAKQGKTVEEALRELSGPGRKASPEEVFDKLKNNMRASSGESVTKAGGEEVSNGLRKREPQWRATSLFDEMRIAESKPTPPRSLDLPNVTRRAEPSPKASSFLLDLEKEMDEIERKKEPLGRPGHKPARQKNEDDTDVEFDDSDNPLDDPEDDFW